MTGKASTSLSPSQTLKDMSDDIYRASRNSSHQYEADGQPKKATNACEFILTFRHAEVLQFCQRGPVTQGSR